MAGPKRDPFTVNEQGNVVIAHWKKDLKCLLSFEQAGFYADHYGIGLGYILDVSDPYTCIDLDVKDADNAPDKPQLWTREKDFERYRKIVETFDSYTETSTSGKGIHIWVYGGIGKGCRFQGVEVYSQERFIVCTGNMVMRYDDIAKSRMIQNRQDWLNVLVGEIREGQHALTELEEIEETWNDWEVWNRGVNAANGDKFLKLAEGDWAEMGFPSQSEADLALLSMLTFYSKSNAQVKRVFRCTGLGLREKAVKNDRYLNDSLLHIRGRERSEEKSDMEALKIAQTLIENAKRFERKNEAEIRVLTPIHDMVTSQEDMDWPPGMTGEVAQYIYNSAPRPVKEVAIATALGLIAGICGKCWTIPQSGLNLYITLVGRSAIGKEAMHTGASSLVGAIISRQPAASGFVDFNDYASGQALIAGVSNQTCFLNIAGEWGKKLRRMSNDTDGPMNTLRTAMTHLFQKSSSGSIVGGITYSKKENNIASVNGVAYSMIGETTPKTFYSALTETMMEDGFLSRFLIIECKSKRPPLNPNMTTYVPPQLADKLAELATYSLTLISRVQTVPVGRTPEAGAIMDRFEEECDTEINKSEEEHWRQMWNRASLKVKRIGALLAVADNWYNPIVQPHHLNWALSVVRNDIRAMSVKFVEGDIGIGDHSRERKIISLLKTYITTKHIPAGYKITDQMIKDGVITKTYIFLKLSKVAAFAEHRMGSNICLTQALNSLIDSGYISEISKANAMDLYNFHGKCYRIIRLPDYDID